MVPHFSFILCSLFIWWSTRVFVSSVQYFESKCMSLKVCMNEKCLIFYSCPWQSYSRNRNKTLSALMDRRSSSKWYSDCEKRFSDEWSWQMSHELPERARNGGTDEVRHSLPHGNLVRIDGTELHNI